MDESTETPLGTILSEVCDERQRQDEQWGGPQHDDTHDPLDWVSFIATQQEKVAIGAITRGESYYATPDCRARFVKIAALAVAALESMDRRSVAALVMGWTTCVGYGVIL